MSLGEKRTWIDAAVALGVPLVYFAVVLGQVPGADVTRIRYVGLLVAAVVVAIVANIVLSIVAAITAPKGVEADERDRQIHRFGEYVGFYVMSIGAILPLGLAMAEAPHFWIAQTLYLAFVAAALVSAATKLVAYRRGL